MYDKMLELGMDGVVFYPIVNKINSVNTKFNREYSNKQFKNINWIPKTSWAYYKFIDGIRHYYDFYNNEVIVDPKGFIGLYCESEELKIKGFE